MMAEPLNIALSGYSIMMKFGLLRLISSVNIIYVNNSILRALVGVRMIALQSYQLHPLRSPSSKCFKLFSL